jgi:hypothetical protein
LVAGPSVERTDEGGTITLAPSMSKQACAWWCYVETRPHRRAVTADGFNDHLPADGIAIHRVGAYFVELGAAGGRDPYADLLRVGGEIEADGWRITVDAGSGEGPAATWTVSVRKA